MRGFLFEQGQHWLSHPRDLHAEVIDVRYMVLKKEREDVEHESLEVCRRLIHDFVRCRNRREDGSDHK